MGDLLNMDARSLNSTHNESYYSSNHRQADSTLEPWDQPEEQKFQNSVKEKKHPPKEEFSELPNDQKETSQIPSNDSTRETQDWTRKTQDSTMKTQDTPSQLEVTQGTPETNPFTKNPTKLENNYRAAYYDSDSDSEMPRSKTQVSLPKLTVNYEQVLKADFEVLHDQSKEYPAEHYLILMKVLVMIFEGQNLNKNDLKFLNANELEILSAVVSKKFKISFSISDPLETIAMLINTHKSSYKHKRNEENYKLIFKKAIKYMTKRLKKINHDYIKDKNKLLNAFYRKYFEGPFITSDIAQQNPGLLSNDPGVVAKTFNGLVFNPKTVNPKYINMVAKSSLFLQDLSEFINNHFFKEYVKTRYTKVERILASCNDTLKKIKNFVKFKDMIEKNPRFKLPWFDLELTKAIKCVQEYLDSNIVPSKVEPDHPVPIEFPGFNRQPVKTHKSAFSISGPSESPPEKNMVKMPQQMGQQMPEAPVYPQAQINPMLYSQNQAIQSSQQPFQAFQSVPQSQQPHYQFQPAGQTLSQMHGQVAGQLNGQTQMNPQMNGQMNHQIANQTQLAAQENGSTNGQMNQMSQMSQINQMSQTAGQRPPDLGPSSNPPSYLPNIF